MSFSPWEERIGHSCKLAMMSLKTQIAMGKRAGDEWSTVSSMITPVILITGMEQFHMLAHNYVLLALLSCPIISPIWSILLTGFLPLYTAVIILLCYWSFSGLHNAVMEPTLHGYWWYDFLSNTDFSQGHLSGSHLHIKKTEPWTQRACLGSK